MKKALGGLIFLLFYRLLKLADSPRISIIVSELLNYFFGTLHFDIGLIIMKGRKTDG
jgi:hypothetical protein